MWWAELSAAGGRDPDLGSQPECQRAEKQAGPRGFGTRDPLWGATCVRKRPSPHRPVPHQSAGLGAGMTPLRPVTGSSAAPAPQIRNARSDPGSIHFRLPTPLSPPPPAPRSGLRLRHSLGAPPAPCAGPHGTGSSKRSRDAFHWGVGRRW